MNANPNAGRAAAHAPHHRALVAALGWVAGIGTLVVYLGGVRFLLHQGAVWLATGAEIVRRALGCP
jgi:hypothetical protein